MLMPVMVKVNNMKEQLGNVRQGMETLRNNQRKCKKSKHNNRNENAHS